MTKAAAALCLAVVLALLLAPQLVASPPVDLPALLRIAGKLTGITPKTKVHVVVDSPTALKTQIVKVLDRDYPREQQTYDQTLYQALGLLGAKQALRSYLVSAVTYGVLGVYDPVTQRLYVRRGIGERRALLHELVHALQDQAFNLRRLSSLRRGSRDAALAASAIVEGHALLATSALGGHALAAHEPKRALAAGCNICFFLQLEQQFPSATGFRFASTLYSLGGRSAVFTALRTFPTTTEQIFHIDKYLTREPAQTISLPQAVGDFSLARSDTFGELDVRALLAVFQVPRLDKVGDGWGGGRSGLYQAADGRSAFAVALSWDTVYDAAQWEEAVTTYVNEAFEPDIPGFPPTTPCGVDTCWNVAGRMIAFARRGTSSALVFGPTIPAAEVVADAVVGQGSTSG